MSRPDAVSRSDAVSGPDAVSGSDAERMTPDEPVFVEYRPNRRRLFGLVAILGVVVLLMATVHVLRSTIYSPSAVVQGYFQALADRDLAAALRQTSVELSDGQPQDLLDPRVLESEAYVPPSAPVVTEVTVDGRSAEVRVEFLLGDQPAVASLPLRRVDGWGAALLRRWQITGGVRRLPLGGAPAEVEVNGVRVVAQDLDGPRDLSVVFGGYQVGVPADDPLWDSSQVTVLVGSDRATVVEVPLAPDPQVRAEVERQVGELLDRCAASSELLPVGCPFGSSRYGQVSDVAWRISSYPELAMTPTPDGFGGVAMAVGSTIGGEAVVTGVREAFGREMPFEIVVPFPVWGVVSPDGAGVVVFQPGW